MHAHNVTYITMCFCRNATAAGKGQAGSSVTLQVASAHAERNLVGRHAMLVYLDIENTPTVFLVTVMPREPSLLGAMMNRKYAAVKKKLVPALARLVVRSVEESSSVVSLYEQALQSFKLSCI